MKLEILARRLPFFEEQIILLLELEKSERQIARIFGYNREVIRYYKKRAYRHLREIEQTGKMKPGRKNARYESKFSKLIEPLFDETTGTQVLHKGE